MKYFIINAICFLLIASAGKTQEVNDFKNNNRPLKKNFLFNISLGTSVPVKGKDYWNSSWNPDYIFSGSTYYRIGNRFLIGLRGAYNYWLPKESTITENYNQLTVTASPSPVNPVEAEKYLELVEWTSNNGEATVIEATPALRFIISDENIKTNLFMHLGIGMSHYKGDINYGGYYKVFDESGKQVKQYNYSNIQSYKFSKPILSTGFGIKGGYFEVLPMYNVVFTEISPTHYFTFNLGISF